MKKCFALLFTVIFLLLSLPIQAAEEQPFETPYELITYWDTNGYPDNVGKPYTDPQTGKVVIPLTWGEKEEIFSMLKNSSDIIIANGTYPYNNLKNVADEITDSYMSAEYGITSVYIGQGLNGGYGENGLEARVVVTIKLKNYAMTAAFLSARYGGCVAFESEQGIAYSTLQDVQTHVSILQRKKNLCWVLPLCVIPPVVILTAFFIIIYKSHKRL